jgi:ADP-heptose:LPS heptosyltransferase
MFVIHPNNKIIGISRTDGLGDSILVLPLVDWLHSQGYTIYWICKDWVKPAMALSPSISRIITIEDLQTDSNDARFHFASIHTLLDLHFNAVVTELAQHYNIKYRVWMTPYMKRYIFYILLHIMPMSWINRLANRWRVLSHRIEMANLIQYFKHYNRLVFRNGNSDLVHISIFNFSILAPLSWLSMDIEAKKQFVQNLPNYTPKMVNIHSYWTIPTEFTRLPVSEPFVVLHYQSHFSSPMWPIKNYLQLQKTLQLAGIKTVWTGGVGSTHFLQENALDTDWNIDLQGKTTLMEMVYLLKHTLCCVVGATGVVHLAGWLNSPHIGLFPTTIGLHTGRWRPLGSRGVYLDHESIEQITVESVWLEIQKLIQ